MEEMSHIPLQPAQALGAQEVAVRPCTGGGPCVPHTHRGTKPRGVGIPAASCLHGGRGPQFPPPPAPLSHPCYNEPAEGCEGDRGRTSPPHTFLWTRHSPIPWLCGSAWVPRHLLQMLAGMPGGSYRDAGLGVRGEAISGECPVHAGPIQGFISSSPAPRCTPSQARDSLLPPFYPR